MVSKKDGRVLSESTWRLSPDAQDLDGPLDGNPAGRHHVWVGTWESQAEKVSTPADWEIQPYEGGKRTCWDSKFRANV